MTALGAPVATDRHQQRRGAPAQRLVRQAPHNGVSCQALAAAASAPLVRLENPAREHRSTGFESLPSDDEPELVESAEGRQISAAEDGHGGSVSHVEVFQKMRRVGTFILGRPRPLSPDRRANDDSATYTLNCEEPLITSVTRGTGEVPPGPWKHQL